MELHPTHAITIRHQPATIYQSRIVSCQYPTNQPTIHVFHIILNIAKYHSHLISYNIHGIIHHAFTVKYSIRHASNHIRKPIRTRARNMSQSRSGYKSLLKRERFSHSGEPFSPNRELEQLNNGFCNFSLRRDLLA